MHRVHKNYYLLLYIYIYSIFLPFVVIDDFSRGEFSLFCDLKKKLSQICCFLKFFLLRDKDFFKNQQKLTQLPII